MANKRIASVASALLLIAGLAGCSGIKQKVHDMTKPTEAESANASAPTDRFAAEQEKVVPENGKVDSPKITNKPVKSDTTGKNDKSGKVEKSKQSSPTEGNQKTGEEKSEGGVWSGVMGGHGRATDIGDNKYAIEVKAGIGFGGAGAMYKVWDKEAKKACNGSYKVIERQVIHDSSGVGKSDRLVGSVECK
jgi:hypothetical protein